MNAVRVVMRNGASFQIQTTMRRTNPYMLQTDTTNNPIYTGESAGLSLEDERMQKLMSRYEGFFMEGAGAEVGAGSGEAAAQPAAAAKAGKKKKK